VGSFISNSLALLSDSGHMLVDMASIVISYLGLRLAAKRTQSRRFNYGWRRVEILAALLNGTILFVMCGIIFSEALQRFAHPEEVHAHELLIVAVIGMIANAIALYNLHGSEHLTTRSAYLHVLTDLLSSVGVIVGAVVIEWTAWTLVDPIISVFITVFIARGAYTLVKKAVVILMESTPEHLDLDVIRDAITSHPSVCGVHDVHVWHIGAHSHALSAHAVVDAGSDGDAVLKDLRDMLVKRFGLTHSTLQLETTDFHATNHCASCDDDEHRDAQYARSPLQKNEM
jgi:cobalt-zinc-cadmium efflux system protein